MTRLKRITVDTVADMVALTELGDGDYVETLGYHAVADGGGNVYVHHSENQPAEEDGGFVIWGSQADNWFEQLDKSVANVRQFGAKGDNATDDTAAFFNCIVAVRRDAMETGRFYMPAGMYHISQTLDFGNLRGCVIQGDGNLESKTSVPVTTFPSSATVLVWAGADAGTMISTSGAGFHIEDFDLFGAPVGVTTPRAGTGILLTEATGVGAGVATINNLSFNDMDQGWVCATGQDERNCADLQFGRVFFQTVDDCFVVNNLQGVNFNLDMVLASDAKNVFKFNAGGKFRACHVAVINLDGAVLNIDVVESDRSTSYIMDYVACDITQIKTPQIVLAGPRNVGSLDQVTIREVSLGTGSHKADGIALFDFGGAMNVSVGNIVGVADLSNPKVSTFDNATNIWTSVAHGFTEGCTLVPTSTGAMPGFYTDGQPAYAVNVTDDTFQLSNRKGWTPINGTTDGTGTLTVTAYSTLACFGSDAGTPTRKPTFKCERVISKATTQPAEWLNGRAAYLIFADLYGNSFWWIQEPRGNVNNVLFVPVGNHPLLRSTGTGSPEGSVPGVIGALYTDIAGGAGTTLYVKESGEYTNTGWVAK